MSLTAINSRPLSSESEPAESRLIIGRSRVRLVVHAPLLATRLANGSAAFCLAACDVYVDGTSCAMDDIADKYQ